MEETKTERPCDRTDAEIVALMERAMNEVEIMRGLAINLRNSQVRHSEQTSIIYRALMAKAKEKPKAITVQDERNLIMFESATRMK